MKTRLQQCGWVFFVAIAMIVEGKYCKGNSEFVSVSFTFDTKTQTYAGGFNLNANKDCALTLHYGEVAAYNSCKDKTVWSFDPSKAKGNGSGTKNASTQISIKPQLL